MPERAKNAPEESRDELRPKELEVRGTLRSMERVAVAYSGGVDSSVLLALAAKELGSGATGVIAVSPSLPAAELGEATAIAKRLGVRLERVESREMELAAYRDNDGARCYWCRSALADVLLPVADRLGAVPVYGAIVDDLGDDRPGMRAAEERGIRAPLLESGLTKREIREIAAALGLPNADKPAAACLASRIPQGREVTRERLARIERAEAILSELGFSGHRVRDHGDVARLELTSGDLERISSPEFRNRVAEGIRGAGFPFVAVDLDGYRPAGLAPRSSTPPDPSGGRSPSANS